MVLEPPPGERTPGDHGQPVGRCPPQRRCDQPPADAPTTELIRNASVDDDQTTAVASVDQFGLCAVLPIDEAMLVGELDDGLVCAYHSPQPGGLTNPVTVLGSTAVRVAPAW